MLYPWSRRRSKPHHPQPLRRRRRGRVAVLVAALLPAARGDDGSDDPYFTLSYERLAELESDIVVSYADTPESSQTFLTSNHAKLMEQVQRGTVAEVVGSEFIASVSPPTALSLTWGLDEYVDILSAAAKAVAEQK